MSVLAPEQYAVYLVTDDPSRYAGDFVENVAQAIAGGVTLVQYRDTESNGRHLYERCMRLQDMLRARGVPLVVNNLPGLALAVVSAFSKSSDPAAVAAAFVRARLQPAQ